jgi:hypothetical protein
VRRLPSAAASPRALSSASSRPRWSPLGHGAPAGDRPRHDARRPQRRGRRKRRRRDRRSSRLSADLDVARGHAEPANRVATQVRGARLGGMCAGCAMAAASAATGFRSWLQTHSYDWLTPLRLRRLTVAAMCAAGLVSTVGISGSSALTHPVAHSQGTHPLRPEGREHRMAGGHEPARRGEPCRSLDWPLWQLSRLRPRRATSTLIR